MDVERIFFFLIGGGCGVSMGVFRFVGFLGLVDGGFGGFCFVFFEIFISFFL